MLTKIKISEKELSRLLPSMFVGSPAQLAESLAYKVPMAVSAPQPKAVEFLPATAADKPVPLAPEASPLELATILDEASPTKKL